MKPKRGCPVCGNADRKLYLHREKLSCGQCLRAEDDDEMSVKVNIMNIRAEAVRDEARRLRKKQEEED